MPSVCSPEFLHAFQQALALHWAGPEQWAYEFFLRQLITNQTIDEACEYVAVFSHHAAADPGALTAECQARVRAAARLTLDPFLSGQSNQLPHAMLVLLGSAENMAGMRAIARDEGCSVAFLDYLGGETPLADTHTRYQCRQLVQYAVRRQIVRIHLLTSLAHTLRVHHSMEAECVGEAASIEWTIGYVLWPDEQVLSTPTGLMGLLGNMASEIEKVERYCLRGRA